MDMETMLFVSSVRWCSGTHRLAIAPANAPARIIANTKKAMINGVNIDPFLLTLCDVPRITIPVEGLFYGHLVQPVITKTSSAYNL
jgi:hypothetical protein